MNYCGSCGSPIPDGQKYCSMCYGDIAYGRDGYYERYMREMMEQDQPEQEARDEEGD